jgi:hypothetical protein
LVKGLLILDVHQISWFSITCLTWHLHKW